MKGGRDHQHAAKKYGTRTPAAIQHSTEITGQRAQPVQPSAEFQIKLKPVKSSRFSELDTTNRTPFLKSQSRPEVSSSSLPLMTSSPASFIRHFISHRFSIHSIKSHNQPYISSKERKAQHSLPYLPILPSTATTKIHKPNLASYFPPHFSPQQPLQRSSRSHSHLLRQTG